MTKHLLLPSRGSYWAGRCLAWLFLLALAPAGAWAQSVASYVPARTTGNTYTSIAGTGTSYAWRNALSTDDNLSAATPIGFVFAYDGVSYSGFSVSTNGLLTFNTATSATGIGTGAYGYQNTQFSAAAGTVTTLAPFYDDQQTAGNLGTLADLDASLKYQTTGTVGNRVLTAEWINMQDFSTTSTSSFNYQVKLYEADGRIEFNYGTMTLSNSTATVTTMSYSLGINAPTISAAPTAAELLTQQSANTNTFSNTLQNALGGTTTAGLPATGSRYSFTAPQPASPITLTFSSVALTSMTVNFVDNSTNENNFQVVFSTDPTFTTFSVGTVTSTTKAATGTAYTANLSGLSANSTYYVRVSSVAEVNSAPLTGSQATLAGFTFGPGPYTIDNSMPTNNTTGGTNFISFTDAINALNTGTLSGPLVFNVAAGQTFAEVPPAITTTAGTATNTITFQKNPSGGANPTIAPVLNSGLGTGDYIVGIFGPDYITFDGINLSDVNSAGGTTAGQREFGYSIAPGSTTNGAQNNNIRNCVITLNGGTSTTPNLGSVGIVVADNGLVAANATTAPNSFNKLNGNTIVGPVTGVFLSGNSATTAANQSTGNEVGSTAGNTITARASGSTSSYGVRVEYQTGTKTENNTVTMGGGSTGTMRGIGYGASSGAGINGAVLINNNTVTLLPTGTPSTAWGIQQGGTSTPTSVAVTNNKVQNSILTGTSGTLYGIEDAYTVAAGTSTITSNQIIGNTTATTGIFYGIYRTGASGTANINGNYIGVTSGGVASGNTQTGASGTMYGIRATTGTITVNGNFIQNNALTNTSGTSSSTLYGYYNLGSPPSETLTGNTFTGMSIGGANTAAGNTLVGMLTNTISTAVKNISGNTIGSLTLGTVGGTMSGTVTGISQTSGTTIGINQNKVYDLTAYGASGVATGILLSSGTTLNVANNLVGNLAAPAATGLLALSGITVSGGTTANVYFNTVYLAASSTGATFGTSGIYLNSTTTTLDLRNTIVDNKSTAAGTGGYTVALRRVSGTAGTAPANLPTTTNNNLYYAGVPSATNLIYAEGTTTQTNAQQTLAAYKTFVGPTRESNSVTEDVAFQSTSGGGATFLHINPTTPTKVESAGQTGTGITTDYDGDTRTATPDIGADEGAFTPIQGVDAQLLSIDGPTAPFAAGSQPVVVTIKNVGTAPITSAIIELFVNTVSQGTTTYTGSLAPGATTQVTLSSFNFQIGTPYTVTATITNVNSGATETDVTNNSKTTTVAPALCGNYNVGSGQPFATLDAAAAALNAGGASCAVTFTLTDATYAPTAGVTINQFPGNNATNTLTIKPAAGVSPTYTTTATATFLLMLNGADYVTIDGSNNGTTTRNLTLTSANPTTGSAVVYVASLGTGAGATFNTVQNLNIVGGSPTLSTAFGVYAAGATISTSGTGADNDNLTVQNNAITTAYEAIYARGVVTTGLLDNLLIAGNQIGSATAASTVTFRGVDVQSAVAPIIRQNRIEGMTTSASISIAAIDLGTTVTNALVSRNNITNLRSSSTSGYGAYGINISSSTGTSGIEISNNMISDILTTAYSASTTFNPFGIRITGGTGHKVYYNSVNLFGAIPAATSTTSNTSAAFIVTSSTVTGLDVRDNVFANSITGGVAKSYALYAAAASSFTTINYNDYFVSGANGILATLDGGTTDRTTLTALQTATAQDANSINVDPAFISATNLHTLNAALNARATPLVGVTVDFDGDPRDPSTPDIGADEFTPLATDLAPTALVAPATGQTCYSSAEAVTVAVKNQGAQALDFTTNPATVTATVTNGAITQTLTGTLTSGMLASGATQNVTLSAGGPNGNGTADMSTAGTYTFAITATVTGDQNTANDALTPSPTRTVTAPVAGTLSPSSTTLCNSGTVAFTLTGSANGSIQYQQSPDNVTFTDIPGATSATYTTPVLTQTMYYRTQTRCGTNVATSNTATVTVNTPLITSTNSPQAVCSGSTATVTANGSSGTTVRFFAASAGGTALATGTAGAATASYTTPALMANTTYYAEAFMGNTENVGAVAYNSTAQTPQTGGALYFTTTGPNTIATVTVFLNAGQAAGTVTISLRAGSSTSGTIVNSQSVAFAVPAGPATGVASYVVPLNYSVPSAGSYTLHLSAATQGGLLRDSGGSNSTGFPYNSPSGAVSITASSVSTFYYYFYNWQFSTECASPTRTPVQVNVNPQPTATASNGGPVCAGSTTTVSFALTGTGPWNLTYSDGTTSTPVTGITTSPYTFTTGALSASTTYTVTALSDANCTATASPVASTTITVRPLPTFSTTQTNVGCFGSSTGSITVTAAGGTAPYEYSINNGVTYTASATNPYTFTGLAVGTYQVLVKGQFCTAATAQAVTISQPASATAVTATKTDETASGANDGTVTATGSGGTSPYQYSLDGTTFLPTTATAGPHTFTGQMAGSYTVTVRDANACTATTTVTVGTAASVCTTTTYTGAAPNDGSNWFNAANWTACVPTRTVDATIPVGLANYPALTTQATAEVRTLTIASGGSLAQSAGTLAVYGNLSNSGTTTLTGGMVSLRGSSPTVTGMSTFYALEVDLSGGTMALSNATSISSGLTMKTGVLSTSSFTLTLLTGSLLSETESSYLLGTVIVPDRTLTAGTAEGFSGIGLVLTPAVGSVSPGLTPVVRTTGTALTGAGSSVSITRYFDIQPATNTGLNVDMVFNYFTHEQNGIPTGNLALFKSVTTTSGPWANQSPITAGIKTISKAGITDFSIWTLGNLGAPLPVELTRFEATRAGSDAALTWSTASEKNSRGFEVQVSTDGRSYRVLSFVASPTAASTSPREYAYLDREASKAGLRYYRLRQLDLDGTATFSPVRTLRFEGKDARSFTAAPNPFRERLTLTVELPAGLVAAPALLSLTDAAGRSLLTQRTPALPAGTSQLELPDLAPLASGVYFVHLAVPGQPVQHLKVVKE
ncbi:Ig-like domain-containing protein [Hymenobacter siberiensis]|uniref:Ig-like domain-containing protein n=1 Tax=Hymenobacter siberiensis TaxID=2848396 RepID=UPI001C1E553C|nr:CARDB domain-containing protein [Hymenobacter siberiensis]